MKKTLIFFICPISILIFSSCASIVSKSTWPITIKSNPPEATITIYNRKGIEVYHGNTPASIKLKSGSGFFKRESYKIKFQKNGYDIRELPIECKLNGWYWGNIIFGGVIGFLIVDPASGAMYKLDIPFISETLSRTTGSIHNEQGLEVMSLSDLPENMKSHLVKID